MLAIITICEIGSVAAPNLRLPVQNSFHVSSPGIADNADPVCFGVYITVPDDPDLLTSAGRGDRCGPAHGPFGLQQVGTSWYRLPAGKGLPTAPPGRGHCGTEYTGWLSGWPAAANGQPDLHYATHVHVSFHRF